MKRLLLVLALMFTLVAPVPSASAAVRSGDLTWGAAQSLDPPRGGFTSISCVSAAWCRAAAAHGSVWNWDGKRWARGRSFGNPLGNALTAMECVSTSFCVASLARTESGGAAPGIEMFDGHRWRTYSGDGIQTDDKNSFGDISCASKSFCMLVRTAGSEATYRMWDGHTWTPKKRLADAYSARSVTCWAVQRCRSVDYNAVLRWYGHGWVKNTIAVPPLRGLLSIDCATATFCAAGDDHGSTYVYRAPNWSGPQRVASVGISTLKCPSTSTCVGLTRNGTSLAYLAGQRTWTAPHVISTDAVLSDVTCPSTTFCAAGSYQGDVLLRRGTHWGSAAAVNPLLGGPTAVSCATASFCVLVDGLGGASTFDGTSWSPAKRVVRRVGGMSDVSCATPSFCMAITDLQSGHGAGVKVMHNGVWTSAATPRHLDFDALPDGVSCTSSTFCAATWPFSGDRDAGYDAAAVWNGSSWTVNVIGAASYLGDVSCVARACLAAHGAVRRYANGTWTDTPNFFPGTDYQRMTSVSCYDVDRCVGVALDATVTQPGIFGVGHRWDGTWHDTPTPAGGVPAASVSCASAGLCVAVGANTESTFDGTNWTAAQPLFPASGNGLVDVSCKPGRCIAVDSQGLVITAS